MRSVADKYVARLNAEPYGISLSSTERAEVAACLAQLCEHVVKLEAAIEGAPTVTHIVDRHRVGKWIELIARPEVRRG